MKTTITILTAWVACWSTIASCQAASITDPIPYTSAADTPLDFYQVGISPQDFESPEGPWEVGFSFDSGMRIGPKFVSGEGVPVTDSVDLDDGLIDGDGTMGSSWFTSSPSLVITLDQPARRASFVFTDTDRIANTITIQAMDPTGSVIAERTYASFADAVYTGTTVDDRFFGIMADASESIHQVAMRIDVGLGIEVDHVQFQSVPEPHGCALGLVALGCFVAYRRRR